MRRRRTKNDHDCVVVGHELLGVEESVAKPQAERRRWQQRSSDNATGRLKKDGCMGGYELYSQEGRASKRRRTCRARGRPKSCLSIPRFALRTR